MCVMDVFLVSISLLKVTIDQRWQQAKFYCSNVSEQS